MTALSLAIRDYRVRENITQKDLAERLGVSANTVHLWESGGIRPMTATLVALAELMHLPVKLLILMAGEKAD